MDIIQVPEQQSLAPVAKLCEQVDEAIRRAYMLRRASQPQDVRVTATETAMRIEQFCNRRRRE